MRRRRANDAPQRGGARALRTHVRILHIHPSVRAAKYDMRMC